MRNENIKVYFVGAGPGAPDLITVRGQRLIEEADMIIYAGSLVNPALLDRAKDDCIIMDSSRMTLEDVVQEYRRAKYDLASNQKYTIVRLHTGDPSIYGAIREQMDALDELEIPYETCPGVSACFGAASSINLEYTLPGISQSLIITRMEGRTAVPEKESIESFAAHNSTMAIYLSAGHIEELVDRLIGGGYSLDTPSCIIYKATWPEEKIITSKLSDLARVSKENGITKTALILVGDVIGAKDYEKSKLYDRDFSTEFRNAKKSV